VTNSAQELFFASSGRINRATYWTRAVPVILVLALLTHAAYAIETRVLGRQALVSVAINLAFLWPTLAVTVKRLHDRGRSAWFFLAFLIPILGPIWLVAEVWTLSGDKGPNQFGDPSKDQGLDRWWVVPFNIASSVVLIVLSVWAYSSPGPTSIPAIDVEVIEARRGPMTVTLNGEGEARAASSGPGELEVVVDYLLADAEKIGPGQRVIVEYRGETIVGRVGKLEAPYSRISALGSEERRVKAIVELADAAESTRLAAGNRVQARVVTWEDGDALLLPHVSILRRGDEWAAFVDSDGRAELRILTLGHTNDESAEILAGIGNGDRVIVYPSPLIEDGTRIKSRN